MRRRTAVAVILLAVMLLLQGCTSVQWDASQYASVSARPQGSDLVAMDGEEWNGMLLCARDGAVSLYVDPETAAIVVFDAASGQWWTSNPEDAAKDPKAGKTAKSALRSQIALTYYGADQKESTFYSYGDCVEKEQHTMEAIPGGVRVTYLLGETRSPLNLLPRYISVERMETVVLAHLSEQEQKEVMKRYIESAGREGVLEYPEATRKNKIITGKIADLFIKAGYDWAQLDLDNQMNAYEAVVTLTNASVSVEYVLGGGCLTARVPVDEIVLTGDITLCSVDLLPFFGAGGTEDEGYLLLPSGSGALINFNNGKEKEAAYQQAVYGVDPLLQTGETRYSAQPIRLPVYGIKRNDAAFLAVIGQGAAQATLLADVSGRNNSYNNVYARFMLRTFETLAISSSTGSTSSMTIFENEIYQGELSVSYYFLGAGAGYSEMAGCLRDVMLSSGTLARLPEEQAPVFVDVLGAIDKENSILGVHYSGLVSMTTTDQAEAILREVLERGAQRVNMRYIGWCNGGPDNGSARSIRLLGGIGGAEGLRALNAALEESGGALYPELSFQLIDSTRGGYVNAREASRQISGAITEYVKYPSSAPSGKKHAFYINSPAALSGQITDFLGAYAALGIQRVCLADLGKVLCADYNPARPIARITAEQVVETELAALADAYALMVSGGNDYALGTASCVTDAPDDSAQFFLIDETVPFYGMVLHGCMDVCGTALNARNDYDLNAASLQMLENGYAPHFLLTYENGMELIQTVYENAFSTQYTVWMEDFETIANVYYDVLAPLRTQFILRHERLGELTVITYEDGTQLEIDYGSGTWAVKGGKDL